MSAYNLLQVGADLGRVRLSADLAALVTAVAHDHDLLRERVCRLTGTRGLARLHAALTAARAAVAAEQAAAMDVAEGVGPVAGDASGAAVAPGGFAASGSHTPPRGQNQSYPSRSVQQAHSPLTEGGPLAANLAPVSVPTPGTGAGASGLQAADSKLGMLWELLHDPRWQLSGSDVDITWLDALGETVVMQVRFHCFGIGAWALAWNIVYHVLYKQIMS